MSYSYYLRQRLGYLKNLCRREQYAVIVISMRPTLSGARRWDPVTAGSGWVRGFACASRHPWRGTDWVPLPVSAPPLLRKYRRVPLPLGDMEMRDGDRDRLRKGSGFWARDFPFPSVSVCGALVACLGETSDAGRSLFRLFRFFRLFFPRPFNGVGPLVPSIYR